MTLFTGHPVCGTNHHNILSFDRVLSTTCCGLDPDSFPKSHDGPLYGPLCPISLFANYEMAFSRINHFSKENPQGRRRAKLALLVSYHLRNRELHRFAGLGPQELARSTS
jgi:hypothetical protein